MNEIAKQVEGQYQDWQIDLLSQRAKEALNIDGIFVEIGCWKGKSGTAIANTINPKKLYCVDTWKGNIDEGNITGKIHPTVKEAENNDIFLQFKNNIEKYTEGNVIPIRKDCFKYLEELNEKVAFCHIDASHDYPSVKKTIEMLLPHTKKGTILCGDDFKSANIKRKDLLGGVEKAVRECLPNFNHDRNFWWCVV